MSMGTSKWQPWVADEEQSIQVLKAAWDRGVNTFDTANLYSNVKQYGIPHSQIILATKCWGLVSESDPTVFTPAAPPSFLNKQEHINQHGLSCCNF
ncbi:hypothetical protein V5O48_003595 [Marasmius crinis-equi]|uniref:NADP-dependent oxidoreductase domain-containing protein n=1 Tax=Marasmius crinis-equi TaxID=585013 RepID=A0ABR3FSH9_9AGAR